MGNELSYFEYHKKWVSISVPISDILPGLLPSFGNGVHFLPTVTCVMFTIPERNPKGFYGKLPLKTTTTENNR